MRRLGTVLASGGTAGGMWASLTMWAGAALLAWSGAVHLHLWAAFGYRRIATIGPLFVFQGVAAIVVAVAVAVLRRVWTALVAFALAAATAGGFLISVGAGLFGFQDTWGAPFAGVAFWSEVATLALLAAGAGLAIRHTRPAPHRSPANRSSSGGDPVRSRART